MRLLCTSDWHLDRTTLGVPRFAELERAVMQTVDEAIRNRATYLFLGDLCDPDAGVNVFRCVELAMRAAMALKQAGLKSIWLAGNHDVIEDGSGQTTLTPMRAIEDKYIKLFERPGRTKDAGEPHIVALPFAATSHNYDPAAMAKELLGGNIDNIVIGHLNIEGVVPGEETNEMPRGRDIFFPVDVVAPKARLMMNGHYHTRQVHRGIHIPGSLARLTFGEETNHPGFLLVEVTDA